MVEGNSTRAKLTFRRPILLRRAIIRRIIYCAIRVSAVEPAAV